MAFSLQCGGFSLVAERGPSYPAAPVTLGGTPIPCIGRWTLNHWTTRKVSLPHFLINIWISSNVNYGGEKKEAPTEADIHTLKDFPIARHPCSTTEPSEDQILTAGHRTWTQHFPQKSKFGGE